MQNSIQSHYQQLGFNFDDNNNNNDVIDRTEEDGLMEATLKKKRGRKSKEDSKYKNPIDKDLLKEMLVDIDTKSANVSLYVRELNKVVDVIFNKHFSKYYTMREDLKSDAILALYNKRWFYDPTKDAYNFIYRIVRNEMTNKLSKLKRISLVDDYSPYDVRFNDDADVNEIPQNVLKWTDYMLGDVDFNCVNIPRKDALDVMVWLKIHENAQRTSAPSFIKPTAENINALYKLLKIIVG